MTNQANTLPPKNHNQPPSDVEWLGENLTLRNVHIIRAAEGHVSLSNDIPDHFTEENEAVFTTDFIKLMQNCQKELERRRKEEKEPFLRQGQYVDSFFGEYTQKLQVSIEKANRPLSDWLQRKADEEKRAREADAKLLHEREQAALRAAAEIDLSKVSQNEAALIIGRAADAMQTAKVADAIAAAPVTSLSRSTGNVGSAALAQKWVGTIKNVDELDLQKLRPYIGLAELQKALDRYVRQGGRICDGAEIKEVMAVKVK